MTSDSTNNLSQKRLIIASEEVAELLSMGIQQRIQNGEDLSSIQAAETFLVLPAITERQRELDKQRRKGINETLMDHQAVIQQTPLEEVRHFLKQLQLYVSTPISISDRTRLEVEVKYLHLKNEEPHRYPILDTAKDLSSFTLLDVHLAYSALLIGKYEATHLQQQNIPRIELNKGPEYTHHLARELASQSGEVLFDTVKEFDLELQFHPRHHIDKLDQLLERLETNAQRTLKKFAMDYKTQQGSLFTDDQRAKRILYHLARKVLHEHTSINEMDITVRDRLDKHREYGLLSYIKPQVIASLEFLIQ